MASGAADDDDDVVIVGAVRTPLCRSNNKSGGGDGTLVGIPPATLFQTVLEELLRRTRLDPSCVDDICVGNVLMPPSGYAALRMAQMAAGIPHTTSLWTVNRQCASSLQAIAAIAQSIQSGSIDIGIAAGVESMSTYSMKSIQPPPVDYASMPPTAMDCLLPMGITSETVVQRYPGRLDRSKLDAFAAHSHAKAAAAQAAGKFQAELVPVRCKNGTLVKSDNGIRPSTTAAVLSKLKPAFAPNGSTTAGNSSQTTDGAAAVLLMKRGRAKALSLEILAVWRGCATVGVPPSVMGIGPAYAIPAVLRQVNLTLPDIDVYEINEAFASQAVWCIEQLGLNNDSELSQRRQTSGGGYGVGGVVNPNGGAIALGHPLGATGARLVVSLVHELHRRPTARFGVVSMCVGTGMGSAAVIEKEPRALL